MRRIFLTATCIDVVMNIPAINQFHIFKRHMLLQMAQVHLVRGSTTVLYDLKQYSNLMLKMLMKVRKRKNMSIMRDKMWNTVDIDRTQREDVLNDSTSVNS